MARAITPNPKARILVVDDHTMVRDGLARLINSQSDLICSGEAANVQEAQAAAAACQPDLAIVDLRLKAEDGLELIKSLRSQFADLRILVLSQYDSKLYVERALRAGALGYVLKEQAADEVLQAIRVVLGGEVYLTRAMAALLLHQFVGAGPEAPRTGLEKLTDTELHVLQLLGAGLSTREIAAEVRRSFKTIETHRENIKSKLGLKGAAELVHYATQWAQQMVSVPQDTIEGLERPRDA